MAISAIVAAVSVGSTVYSINQQKKAARAQQRQQQLQSRRSQRQAIREAQIRQAQLSSSALGLGAAGGSAVSGGLSSLSSQVGGTLGYASQMSGLSKEISLASQRAQTAGAVADLGATVFTGIGGFDTLSKKLGIT